MSDRAEERGVSSALGSIPQVNNQRAFKTTITIVGTGTGDVIIQDIVGAITSQNTIFPVSSTNFDQMYIHRFRVYGTAGGYLSMAPYPHRQYAMFPPTASSTQTGTFENTYGAFGGTEYRRGALTQMYEFGINGSTRPSLKWDYPETEILNNPFTLVGAFEAVSGSDNLDYLNTCKLCTIQSTNTGGDALYIVQVDVTVRQSEFIPITTALGGAAFGEENVVVENYLPPLEGIKRKEDGEKALELANKKRKIKNVKDLQLPTLDGK